MQLAFGLAGAAIGSFIPGIGTSIGWSLGVMIGGALSSKDTELAPQFGPRLSDLNVQTSTYGKSITILYGTARIAGNLFWLRGNQVDEHITTTVVESESGKGGGSSTTQSQSTFSYTATCAIGLCEGEKKGIRKAWRNGIPFIDIGVGSDPASVLASSPALTFYPGSETQAIDPTMDADHPGLTPAYRGLCFVLFTDLELGGQTSLDNFEFEVVSEGTDNVMLPTPLYNLAEPNRWPNELNGDILAYRRNTPGAIYLWIIQETPGSPPDPSKRVSLFNNYSGSLVFSDDGANNRSLLGVGWNSRAWVQEQDFGYFALSTNGEKNPIYMDLSFQSGGFNRIANLLEFPEASFDPEGAPVHYIEFNSAIPSTRTVYRMPGHVAVVTNRGINEFADSANRIPGRLYLVCYQAALQSLIGWVDVMPGGTQGDFNILNTYTAVARRPQCMVGKDGYLYVRSMEDNQANVLEKRTQDFAFVDSLTLTGLSNTAYGSDAADHMIQDDHGNLYVQVDRLLWRINYGTMEVEATATLANNYDWILPGDSFQGSGILVIRVEDDAVGAVNNNVVRVLLDSLDSTFPLLSEVVTDLCERGGLFASDIDVSDLTGIEVEGYVITARGSVRSMLEPLMGTYGFDAVESDGKIKFVLRGGALAVTIPEDHLAARSGALSNDTPDQLTITRKEEMELPAQLDVNYFKRDFDYQISTQSARRLITQSKMIATLNVPIVLSDAQAAQLAHKQLYNAWMEREGFAFATHRAYAQYEPTDIYVVEKNGVMHGGRFTHKDEGADGVIRWKGVADATYIYSQTATGAAQGTEPGGVRVVGPTEMVLLDSPLLRDADDTPGVYSAARGLANGWRGGQLFISRDGGVSYEFAANRQLSEATMGRTFTILNDGDATQHEAIDWSRKVRVVLDEGNLVSVTRDELFAGANAAMCGRELIQYLVATFISANTYDITGILGGRLGSESFMTGHVAGERFVFLNSVLANVPLLSTDKDITRTYKAVTLGATLPQTAPFSFVNTDRRLKPLAPAHLRLGKTDSGDWLIEWNRRSRYRSNGFTVPLGENAENYSIYIYTFDGTTLLRTLTSTSESVRYTAAQQAADIGGETYALGVQVAQMSDRVGVGYLSDFKAVTLGAYRYWLLTDFTTVAGHFEMGEIELRQGVADVSAGFSGDVAPIRVFVNFTAWNNGNTAFWFDRNLAPAYASITTAQDAGWQSKHIKIVFDQPVNITGIRLAGGDNSSRHLTGFTLKYAETDSDPANSGNTGYITKGTKSGLTFPGNNTWSTEHTF